jgi:hypothetical protein
MEYFGSFVGWAAFPYLIGFLALCFWWRWWLLLPVGAIAAIFTGSQYAGALSGDGPGLAMGILLAYFLALGAGCGFIASGAVLIGRANGWRLLNPALTLPFVFVLGFGIHMLFYLAHAMATDARFAPPPENCFNRTYSAQLGDVDLALPTAPGLSFFETGSNRLYGLSHNPDIRALCSKKPDETTELRSISFALGGLSAQRTREASRSFCSRGHPQYPWAEMACKPLNVREIIFDKPLYITIAISDPGRDLMALERDRVAKSPRSVTADGLKIYQGKHGLLFERPDGYLASCSSERLSKTESYLDCNAKETLSGQLMIAYQFKTTEARFFQETPQISATARAFFQSLAR